MQVSENLNAALNYVQQRGWPIFPTRLIRHPNGKVDKVPLVKWVTNAAAVDARDPETIKAWWCKWPDAVISIPTGKRSGIIVLDIDCKPSCETLGVPCRKAKPCPIGECKAKRWGFDTLTDDLGKTLPDTPLAHTVSDGVHAYFACNPAVEIRNSEGEHGLGLGLGLDIRGDGGQVVIPSPGSGYTWDPFLNFDTVALRPAPAWLGHKPPKQAKAAVSGAAKGDRPRFDPQAFLNDACDRITRSREGSRYRTYRQETFRVGTLVRDKLLTEREARHALEAVIMPLGIAADGNTDKVWAGYNSAFAEGLSAPSRRAGRTQP